MSVIPIRTTQGFASRTLGSSAQALGRAALTSRGAKKEAAAFP
jgi:hypothetical protein